MSQLGTPLSESATRVVLLGCGELGKEVAIELQRFGVEVIGVDRYTNAPAMQIAHRSHVIDMTDAAQLRAVLDQEKPDLIVPEIEAIATSVLVDIEAEQPWPLRVVPTARAAHLTMNREGIRTLAAEELSLPTSPYRFVDSEAELRAAVSELGLPSVLKPVMSSSGKGQSVIATESDIAESWQYAQSGARVGASGGKAVRCIIEGFIEFDYEITVLTVRHSGGTTFFDPIFHRQVDGDYVESWQGEPMSADVLAAAHDVARTVTDALGGWGVFGVELFVRGTEVIFSEVSPRPHDTGLVTLVSQDISEFAAHARALLGLPVAQPARLTEREPAAASVPVKVSGTGVPSFRGVSEALSVCDSGQVRLFGKPSVDGERRVAVTLARGADVAEARERANRMAALITVDLG